MRGCDGIRITRARAERAGETRGARARDGDGCVIFFNIVYARVMGCVY